ncbi:MAG: hypothetical protein IJQ45_10845 [Clostridia bacterium]|nr:hypothetical protein [Clostridia bacterium]
METEYYMSLQKARKKPCPGKSAPQRTDFPFFFVKKGRKQLASGGGNRYTMDHEQAYRERRIS